MSVASQFPILDTLYVNYSQSYRIQCLYIDKIMIFITITLKSSWLSSGLDFFFYIIIFVVSVALLIFILSILFMVYCKRKLQRSSASCKYNRIWCNRIKVLKIFLLNYFFQDSLWVRLFIEVQIIGYDLTLNHDDVFMYRSVWDDFAVNIISQECKPGWCASYSLNAPSCG